MTGILHLGNISFDGDDDAFDSISSNGLSSLQQAAECLEVWPDLFWIICELCWCLSFSTLSLSISRQRFLILILDSLSQFLYSFFDSLSQFLSLNNFSCSFSDSLSL